ncbi:MAG: hypothetical protein M1814_005631 [Vezdaea aestivalis]|nr:MAG: hypothetical protein M1814_005631 [Vezdaea aestivalis]
MASGKSDIHLYTVGTPNGIKVSILLEELGLPYKTTAIEMSKNEQKEPWFLAINPNGRIPAITDTLPDGSTVNVFESGSIMQYLTNRYDTAHKLSYPAGSREDIQVTNWLFFQNAGVGPMQGQANHFKRYAPEKIQYGIDRYVNETKRLYQTLDTHLADTKKPYLVGDKCTIADIAHYGWVAGSRHLGIDLKEFPALDGWLERMRARPGVEKGRNVPTRDKTFDEETEESKKALEETKKWIMDGQKKDAEKKAAQK